MNTRLDPNNPNGKVRSCAERESCPKNGKEWTAASTAQKKLYLAHCEKPLLLKAGQIYFTCSRLEWIAQWYRFLRIQKSAILAGEFLQTWLNPACGKIANQHQKNKISTFTCS